MTPQERAQKCADTMFEKDLASNGLGMQIEEIAPGRAVISMHVRPDMVNGFGIAHGGLIFTLADSAFAFACNSYNKVTVAQQNQITFLTPGKDGERLTAEAVEVSRAGRSGTYDVTVRAQDGREIALMRGLCRIIKGQTFPEGE